jgi:hypothetical protein
MRINRDHYLMLAALDRHDTNLLAWSPLESKEGTPTFGNAGLSSATPRGTAVKGLASQ